LSSVKADFSAYRTLVVDDQSLDRQVFCAILRKLGIQDIMQCESGQCALAILSDLNASNQDALPDLIILDVHLGDMNGLELCKKIRRLTHLKSVPIAMQSSESEVDIIRQAFANGAQDYFIKPLRPEEIGIRLQSMMLLREEMKASANKTQALSQLLRKIFPEPVANTLEETGELKPSSRDDTAMFILDFAGASKAAVDMHIEDLMTHINAQFDAFDIIADHYGITRIKTVGDEYQTVAGLFEEDPLMIERSVAAAFDIRCLIHSWMKHREAQNLPCWDVRMGLHRGAIAWGIFGRTHYQFDLIGSTFNETHRICTASTIGEIWASDSLAKSLGKYAVCISQGSKNLRNIGDFELFQIQSLADDAQQVWFKDVIPHHDLWRKDVLPMLCAELLMIKDQYL
jgi:CheY-like chemotaxis protein